jgi:aspartate/methionine/tyrosine aminotransferase
MTATDPGPATTEIDLALGWSQLPAAIDAPLVTATAWQQHRYIDPFGLPELREAIAGWHHRRLGLAFDPVTEVTVLCGVTEALSATFLSLLDAGDEIIVFEPAYDGYARAARLARAVIVPVAVHPSTRAFDPADLRAAITPRTRMIVVNSPVNPTGGIVDRAAMAEILAVCEASDLTLISDEVYEVMIYDGREHHSPLHHPGARDRTILVNSMSKTFHVAGWRIGYTIAPPAVTARIRNAHDGLTYSAASHLQMAAVAGYRLGTDYEQALRADLQRRRDLMVEALRVGRLDPMVPAGAFYVCAGFTATGCADDAEFARELRARFGVAVSPGRNFHQDTAAPADFVRLCFARDDATLHALADRMRGVAEWKA